MTMEIRLLRACAILIGIRALTNFLKPFGIGTGFVFGGRLLHGPLALSVLAPLVGVFMLVYAFGLWRQSSFALPMGVAYAGLVLINLGLFPLLQPLPPGIGPGAYAGFVVVAVGVTWGAVWLLVRVRRAAPNTRPATPSRADPE